jgi:organic radical activating enzyme
MINDSTIFLSDDKIFYTIEGEGEHIGKPSVFMRLSMCNLTCQGFKSADAPYGCDSFVSWSVKNKLTIEDILNTLESHGYVRYLQNGAIWKITGGEPLIQQNKLLELVDEFYTRFEFIPRIDFETNATIMPRPEWRDIWRATFTTSPKLSNNGDPEDKRYKPEVIKWHVNNGSGFKFVINGPTDLNEVMSRYINDLGVPRHRVWLMPCCGSRDEHTVKAAAIAETCKENNFNFSPRLQLVIWDKALKV